MKFMKETSGYLLEGVPIRYNASRLTIGEGAVVLILISAKITEHNINMKTYLDLRSIKY